MSTPNLEAVETFMSITGAPESVAIQRLEEYGGNLNEAVNAHFSEGDRNVVQEAASNVTAPPNDFMDVDDPPQMESRGRSSLLSAVTARGLNPFSLLDPTFVSQPREVREVPIELTDGRNNLVGHSGHGPRIEDVTDSVNAEGPEIRGNVITDDVIIVDEYTDRISERNSRPSAPHFDDTLDDGNDIEEEMIRAAIEASKRDAQLQNMQDLPDVLPQHTPSQHDDGYVAHVVSSSFKTAEHERLQREQGVEAGGPGSSANRPVKMEEIGSVGEPNGRPFSSQHKKEVGSSSIQDDVEEFDEQPLVRNRSRSRSSASTEARGEEEVSPAVSPPRPNVASHTQLNENAFHTDEWGGISSEEHDEAVMLEAAMFGGVPETGYRLPFAQQQLMRSGLDFNWTSPRPPSPSLVAQRAIREQQDDEYLASLQADRERELRAMEEEKAAREAALEEQRQKEEEFQRKLEEEQEIERQLAAKEACLPKEPAMEDENAVSLVVKMPDGSRHGRRFLKSDKLQCLFDFIDIGRQVKPGTYRMVRPYPRRAFGDGESSLTLNDLGLTSKQEALFLESI